MLVPADPDTIVVQSLFTSRVSNVLRRAGIETAAQLLCYTASDLRAFAEIGSRTLAQINAGLVEHGLDPISDPGPETGPSVVELHRRLLARHHHAVAILERALTDPEMAPSVRAQITEVVSVLSEPLTLEQRALLRRDQNEKPGPGR